MAPPNGHVRPSLEVDDQDAPPPKRLQKDFKGSLPLYAAVVIETATSYSDQAVSSASKGAPLIIERIKKCLERGTHGNNNEIASSTIENGAKAAMRMAERLMNAHNIKQADILAQETPENQKLYAGRSIVSLRRIDGDKSKPVMMNAYVGPLCSAVRTYFDCKSYSSKKSWSIEFVFNGITEQTAAAAEAFQMVYNLVVGWSYGFEDQFRRINYCLGVADELALQGRKIRTEEERRAKQAEEDDLEKLEELQRRHILERVRTPYVGLNSENVVTNVTQGHLGGASQDSVSPIRQEVLGGSKATESAITIKTEEPPEETPDPSGMELVIWPSHMKLTAFRETAAIIADEYLP